MKRALIAMAALALPSAAMAAEQFDLVCSSQTAKSGQIRFRVDLQRGEWCWEDCRWTWKIADVTPNKITFKDEDTPSGVAFNSVSRVTGEWTQFSRSRLTGTASDSGTCKPAPFTGFGDQKAKF